MPTDPSAESNDVQAVFEELRSIVTNRLAADRELRRAVQLLAQWLATCAADPPVSPAAPPASDNPVVPVVEGLECDAHSADVNSRVGAATTIQVPPPDGEQIAQLLNRFGSAVSLSAAAPTPRPRIETPTARSIDELNIIAKRMALKAVACDWAVKRYDAEAGGYGFDPVKPEYERIRAAATTMQPCFLWMINQSTLHIARDDWITLGGCYRACADAINAVIEFPVEFNRDTDLLKLMAETQSAILAAMVASGAHQQWTDHDQQFVFGWCRDEASRRLAFIDFLSRDSLVDPSLHAGMAARIARVVDDLRRSRTAEKSRRRGLNTVRYHVEQLADADEATDHHWKRICEGVREFIAAGGAPSNVELVERFAPIADDVPEEMLGTELRTVLQFVDQQAARLEAQEQRPAAPARQASPDVQRVRDALRGSRVVLIGGDERRYAKELIEREFELAELDWQVSKPHQSVSYFEPAVARKETRLVMLMIRWASHSFEAVADMCVRHNKPFVRLPRGYNPHQIAHQIVLQASMELQIPGAPID